MRVDRVSGSRRAWDTPHHHHRLEGISVGLYLGGGGGREGDHGVSDVLWARRGGRTELYGAEITNKYLFTNKTMRRKALLWDVVTVRNASHNRGISNTDVLQFVYITISGGRHSSLFLIANKEIFLRRNQMRKISIGEWLWQPSISTFMGRVDNCIRNSFYKIIINVNILDKTAIYTNKSSFILVILLGYIITLARS